MKKSLSVLLITCVTIKTLAQTLPGQGVPTDITKPIKVWDKRFGGSEEEVLRSIIPTNDGGYLLGGKSSSSISGEKSENNRGSIFSDGWIIKIDSNGVKAWDKSYGGSEEDDIMAMLPTSDGGYILGGYSASGISGNRTESSRGGYDYWVIKIDAKGNKLWDKAFGGAKNDFLCNIVATPDGGYLLGGSSQSGISGDRTETLRDGGEFDNADFWVVKIDNKGTKLWDKRFGGSGADLMYTLAHTHDGGYLLGGESYSEIGFDKTAAHIGAIDYWVIKIDANGNKLWDKSYGGKNPEELRAILRTNDGGYVLGGSSGSRLSEGKTEASLGEKDFWIVKIDADGKQLWDKTFGAKGREALFSLESTEDGGFIAGGTSDSEPFKDKTEKVMGDDDYWLVRIDKDGNKLWDKTIGSDSFDDLTAILVTKGGYLIGGQTSAGVAGDKTQPAHEESDDFWIVKLKSDKP